MTRRLLLQLLALVIISVALTVSSVFFLTKIGVKPEQAAGIAVGVMAAIAAAFSLFKEARLGSQLTVERSTRQEVESKLQDLEADRRGDELRREQRAKETFEAISAKCKAAPKLEDIHWKDDVFINQIKWTDAVARTLRVGARLIVVASGKGGVGKSTLSLGLLEAFSRFNKTLLIDFDMHNRGLTSLLHEGTTTRKTNILTEMERFHQLYTEISPLSQASGTDPHSQMAASFETLRLRFAQPGTNMALRSFKGQPVQPPGEISPVHPKNSYFMPSSGIDPNERFLSSRVFRSQFDEVYFFLKCLSYWAGNIPNGFHTVILDCHGAHDHFMIGAIHAASALLVVTTPEPGAFDGTYDLLAFAKVLRQLTPGESSQFPTALAINNNLDWQQSSVDAITKFVQKPELDFVETITVPSDNHIRQVTNNYECGDISQIRPLWTAASKVYTAFEEFWDRLNLGDQTSDPQISDSTPAKGNLQ